uniref:Putative ovule protein n=1 Tax=Solanum chacoense TaxID=4108 RepID=A0A0V0GLM1_SOLCH
MQLTLIYILLQLAELNGLCMPGSKFIQLQNSIQSGKKTSSWLLEFRLIKIDKAIYCLWLNIIKILCLR